MYPTLVHIGSFEVPSFGIMVMLGFLGALWLSRRRASRFGIAPEKISDVAFWGLAAGILGARIGFIVQELPYYLRHPNELFSLRFEGLTSFGGVVLAILTIVLLARRMNEPVLKVMDVLAPGFLIGNIMGRIGCLLNGCCYGPRSLHPWAVRVADREGLFQPAQLYDAGLNLLALILFFLVFDRRSLRQGQATAFVLMGYGVSRFVYEFWRAGSSSTTIAGLPLTEAQIAALVVAVLGAVLWVRSARMPRAAAVAEAPAS